MENYVYLAFYKPDGVLTAFTDPEGRETLKSYIDVPDVYPVGRLDLNSEGLLLLTNDGELAHRLTDPRYNHPKTYLVQVEGTPSNEQLAELESGVEVKGIKTRRAQVLHVPEPNLPPRRKTRHAARADRMAAGGTARGKETSNSSHDRGGWFADLTINSHSGWAG